MKPIDLFLFDLDGTLAATGDDLVHAVNHALKTIGLPVLEPALIISFVGDGIRQLVIRALGPENRDYIDQAIDIFDAYYQDHALDFTVLYPGVADSLDHFKRKKKVVLTNKRQSFAEHILNALGIAAFFDRVIGGDTYAYMKPDTRLIAPLLEEFRVERDRTVMVGDGKNDILLAKSTGIVSCAFLGGLTKPDILIALQPDYVCESLAELPKYFI